MSNPKIDPESRRRAESTLLELSSDLLNLKKLALSDGGGEGEFREVLEKCTRKHVSNLRRIALRLPKEDAHRKSASQEFEALRGAAAITALHLDTANAAFAAGQHSSAARCVHLAICAVVAVREHRL